MRDAATVPAATVRYAGRRELITQSLVSRLRRAPPAGHLTIRDTQIPGFVLRLRPSGRHSFAIELGRGRWATIGELAVLTATQARDEAGRLRAEQRLGRDPIASRRAARTPTLREYLADRYGPWVRAHRKTGDEMVQRLASAFADLLSLKLSEITAWHVEKWRAARLRDDKVEATTVNRDLNGLKSALARAVEWKVLLAHPLKAVKPAKTDAHAIVRYLDVDEETRLRAALEARDEARRAERDRANEWRRERSYDEMRPLGTYTDHLTPLVLLALNTGLRRGELFHLTWADVDLARAWIVVRGASTKSGQTRHVPLNRDALTVLRAWRAQAESTDPVSPSHLVFPGADAETPLEDIKTGWRAIVKAAKVAAFRFHDCRHHFASRLVQAGVDLNTVRELLGHSDLKMTLRYAHLASEQKVAAVARLERRA